MEIESVIRTFPQDLDYRRIIRQCNACNLEEVQYLARVSALGEDYWSGDTKKLVEKVQNFLVRNGVSVDELSEKTSDVLGKIDEDEYFQMFFRKDPKKQNVAERSLLAYLETIVKEYDSVFYEVNRLSGLNSLYVLNGLFAQKKPKRAKIKSIDFEIELQSDNKYYLFHKFTEGNGGAQDEHETDVVSCMENAGMNKDDNIKFVFVCDGDRFDSELDELKREHNKDNIIVCSTPELKETLILNALAWK